MSDAAQQRKLERNQLHLFLITCVLALMLSILLGFVMFAQPAHIDVVIPTVPRFNHYGWYKVVPFAMEPVVLLLVVFALAFPLSRFIRIIAFVLVIASIAWFIGVLIADAVQMAQRNDPADPRNPANSYYACCTAQFFTAVASCPNFGNPTPQCFPPRTISDIGVNGDFVMVFIIELLTCLFYCLIAVLLLQMDHLLGLFLQQRKQQQQQQQQPSVMEPLVPVKQQQQFFF